MKENLSKAEKGEMEKLVKEKDKLAMQAMVLRMQERDNVKKEGQKTKTSQQEGPDLSNEEVVALRKVARDKYVREREEQQMHLYKKILDDQKKMFLPGKQDEGTLIEEIHKRIGKGEQGSLNEGLSEIEKRRIEIDEKLYALANKHREAYKDQKEAAQGY